MATRLAETLLAADADLTRIHRRVVRVGAAAAWTAAAVFLTVGFLGAGNSMFAQAIGPILAAVFMTTQIIIHREHGGLALFASAVVTTVMYSVIGDQLTLLPASLALVVICSIGILLVETRQILWASVISLFLGLAPQFWALPLREAIQLGVVMALGFLMAAAIFFTIRNAATVLNARFQTLFQNSPTAVLEEDWSEALAYVRSEYTGRPERIKPFLMAYPAVVKRAVARARIVRVNRAAVELLEAGDAQDLLGYRDGTSVTDETIEAFAGALIALYEGREAYEQETPALTMKGRHIWLQTRSVDVSTDGAGTRIIVGLADVTHMKERQEAMVELVKAKDEFIARISHELRTPLTAVVGLTSEMAAMDGLGEEERNELMSLVAGQAAEMSYIVEDLLVAARAEMGTLSIDVTLVDLGSELASAIDGLGIALQEVPESIPKVVADPSRIRQILRNLLTNAERYGGPNRRVLAGRRMDRVWLEVRDDGHGVPIEEETHIFEPYATAHSGVKESVGLGLSVARQLTELVDGSLTYHRDLDETVFRLELPAALTYEPALASGKPAQ